MQALVVSTSMTDDPTGGWTHYYIDSANFTGTNCNAGPSGCMPDFVSSGRSGVHACASISC
jgi:hypothetical protein